MIAIWIIGVGFTVVGFIIGVRRIIKVYKYCGEVEGLVIDYESITGTEEQSIRIRYKYYVNGVEYIGKSEYLNNAFFYLGKKCKIRYDINNPRKSYLKTFDRVIQNIIGVGFFIIGIGIIMLGFIILSVI